MIAVSEAETTQPINYLDCETLTMRLPEPPEDRAGHRGPRAAERLRKTARRAVLGVRRRIVGAWDRIWPPMFGVFVGFTVWLIMAWVLWEALVG